MPSKKGKNAKMRLYRKKRLRKMPCNLLSQAKTTSGMGLFYLKFYQSEERRLTKKTPTDDKKIDSSRILF